METVVVGLPRIALAYLALLGFAKTESRDPINDITLPVYEFVDVSTKFPVFYAINTYIEKIVNVDNARFIFLSAQETITGKPFMPWAQKEIEDYIKENASFAHARTIGAIC